MDEIILLSYFKGKANENENSEIEAWYKASPDHQKRMEQLYYMLFLDGRMLAMNSVNVEESLAELKRNIQQKEKRANKIHPSWRQYATIAAAFLTGLVFACGIAWGALSDDVYRYSVQTEPGQRAQVVLPDGTKVWMNASTQVAYESSFFSSERRVNLTGEAYFEVARDERTPFVVTSRKMKTRVLGTKFNIRANENDKSMITTLLEGSVRLIFPDTDRRAVTMIPNQQLRFNTVNQKAELANLSDAKRAILWIEGKIRFEQATLSEIAKVLEERYGIYIHIKNEALKQQRFTCDFEPSDSAYQIIFVLSLTNKFNYQIENKEVTITAKQF